MANSSRINAAIPSVFPRGTPSPDIRRLYDASRSRLPARLLARLPRRVHVSSHAGQRHIFRNDLDSKTKTDLLTDDAEWSINPTVSPDGRWLALYGRVNKDGDPGVILIPIAGGAQSHGISWTPDSKRLLFDGTDASTEIWSLHNLPR